mmetsp:Transcript_1523/g.4193  ORF Transcript_1523/g.4193 Transcript_1523/m.4193 type:complete len:228 (-) Transcript_1523:1001-1684(-)
MRVAAPSHSDSHPHPSAKSSASLHQSPTKYIRPSPFRRPLHTWVADINANTPVFVVRRRFGDNLLSSLQQTSLQTFALLKLLKDNFKSHGTDNSVPFLRVESRNLSPKLFCFCWITTRSESSDLSVGSLIAHNSCLAQHDRLFRVSTLHRAVFGGQKTTTELGWHLKEERAAALVEEVRKTAQLTSFASVTIEPNDIMGACQSRPTFVEIVFGHTTGTKSTSRHTQR